MSSYPYEIGLQRDGVLMPQDPDINLIDHTPSTDKSLSVTLKIVVIVEYNTPDKHIMRTVSSIITKLT